MFGKFYKVKMSLNCNIMYHVFGPNGPYIKASRVDGENYESRLLRFVYVCLNAKLSNKVSSLMISH